MVFNLFRGPFGPDSITNKTAKLISDIQSRKNSVKYKILLGHEVGGVLLTEFTYCSICSGLIWGLVGQRCKLCKLVSHKRCLDHIESRCASSHQPPISTVKPHQFEKTTFWKPTFCNHCGLMIMGVMNQGQQCLGKGCGMKVHHECKKLVGYECGQRDWSAPKRPPSSDKDNSQNGGQFCSRTSIEDFELIKIIGTGSYGKVYLAKRKDREFAIKVVKKTHRVVSSDPESTLTEMEVLKIGRSYQFLTTAHCCFQSRDRLFFVMEYVEGKDLLYHIEKSGKFSEARTRFHSAEIFLALRYLHQQGIIHRDLKLEHVMLDKHGHCVLLDFGMAKNLNKCPNQRTRTFCGTPNYMSPEVCSRLDYGPSVDWWALGVIMFAMLLDYFPFDSDEEEEVYQKIQREAVEFPWSLSDVARNILEGLLTKDPSERLGCKILEDREQEIRRHPFYLEEKDNPSTWWDDMEAQRIPPPYHPTSEDLEQSDTDSLEQYQPANELTARLTPIDSGESDKIQQSDFEGFSYRSESFDSETIKYLI